MNMKKWITYGVTGVVGLGVLAGGAVAAASTMDLRTDDGNVVPGGAITERGSVIDGKKVQLSETNSSVTVVSAPSPLSVTSTPSAPSAKSPVSKPSAPSVNSPVSEPSAPSVQSPVSKPSAPSVQSPVSKPSAPSVNSPDSAPSAASN